MKTGDTEKLRATGVKVNTFSNLKLYYIMHGLFYLFTYLFIVHTGQNLIYTC